MRGTGWVDRRLFLSRRFAGAACLCCAGLAQAAEESGWDRAWSITQLYRSETGWIRSVDVSGRFHYDIAYIDSDAGYWHDYDVRRMRLGGKIGFAGDWLLHVEGSFDYNSWEEELESSLTDAYLAWSSDSGLRFKALKQSAGFTLDGATSSTRLLTPERNMVANNLWFTTEYFTGFSVAGSVERGWSYKLGAFSSDGDDELSDFGTGYFGLATLKRDFADDLDLDQALLQFDYVYNDDHEESATADFEHILSFSTQWQQGRWGLRTDLAAGHGHAPQPDVWGLVLMPIVDLSERWQLVLRYTYLDSDGANGLELGRYEDRVVEGQGDRYDEFFAGINLFLYGHKFKLQGGLQYADMDDAAHDGGRYRGLGITTALRMYW